MWASTTWRWKFLVRHVNVCRQFKGKVLNFKVWRTNFEFLTLFSWSSQWCRKRQQIMNLFWTTFFSINIQRDLNFGAFYYIIDNFSCCSKYKCWRETIRVLLTCTDSGFFGDFFFSKVFFSRWSKKKIFFFIFIPF